MDSNESFKSKKRDSLPSINPSSPEIEERKQLPIDTASPTASFDRSDLLSRVP